MTSEDVLEADKLIMKSHLETALTRLLKMEIKPATDAGRSLGGHGLGGGSWVGGSLQKLSLITIVVFFVGNCCCWLMQLSNCNSCFSSNYFQSSNSQIF